MSLVRTAQLWAESPEDLEEGRTRVGSRKRGEQPQGSPETDGKPLTVLLIMK